MQAILHCDRNWGIGKRNDLMFSLPKDMKFFRTTTSGKVVVMGSNTLLSFPGGKPLKNRTNIVLWPGGDEKRAQEDGFTMVQSLSELFSEIRKYPSEDVFVIGGAYGFSDDVYAHANEKISLSQMTFSHQMVRLVFTEQIYRACTIIKGEPYHHE